MKLIKQSFEILEQKDFTLKGIKQFIEKCGALWHTEDEIPKADRLIITKGRNYKDEYTMYDTTEELCLADFDRKLQWESFCKLADFDFTWCYIEDLLPKGDEE